MKKFTALLLAVIIISVLGITSGAAYQNLEITVSKTKTAPVLDGVIGDNEWTKVSSYPKDASMFTKEGENIENYNVDFYANWDDSNFYFAVVADCKPKHIQVFDNDKEDYIFNKHHIMFSILQGDPKDAAYVPTTGADEAWDWGEAYAHKDAREVSVALRETGELVFAEHMGTGFADSCKYIVKSANGKDIYELAIPFSYFGNTDNNIGGIFGFAFSAGMGNATDEENAQYVYFSGGLDGGKYFQRFAVIKLGDYAPAAVKTDDKTSVTASATGDIGFALYAVLALASAAVIAGKKKSKNNR